MKAVYHDLNAPIEEAFVAYDGDSEIRIRLGAKGIPPHIELAVTVDEWNDLADAVTRAVTGDSPGTNTPRCAPP
jgi:hypothetical protein